MLHRTIAAVVVISMGCAPETYTAPEVTDLRVNEVAASGDPLDWVELITVGDTPIRLDGLYITDDEADPGKGALPVDVVVIPGEHVVVELDEFGVGFRLGSDEAIFLINPDGETIDGTDWDDGASPDGGSWGRSVDGSGDFVTFSVATRGASNG